MANEYHLSIFLMGVEHWNEWREQKPQEIPDLSGFDFTRLSEAQSMNPGLSPLPDDEFFPDVIPNLNRVNLSEANLEGSIFTGKLLIQSNFSKANLRYAWLNDATLKGTDLTGADLREANLKGAKLVKTNLRGANLSGAFIYGISAWDVNLEDAIQQDLVITRSHEPVITLDNIEVAQFIYLLMQNPRVKGVIDTVTQKVVLILGRFTPERKLVLDALRDELRKRNYVPVLFDFDKPARHSLLETISTLARMSKFVIADLTEAKSVLQELQSIVPDLPTVPVQPLIMAGESEPGMIDFFRRYPWFLTTYEYNSLEQLCSSLGDVIAPAEQMSNSL